VSNEMTGDEATVRVGSGVLLAVMPGGVGAPAAGVPRSPPWT
jgi:hypothetical protein